MEYLVVLLMAAMLAVAAYGCKAPSGSREWIPGKGWLLNP